MDNLPRVVRENLEEAERMHQQIYGNPDETATQDNPAPAEPAAVETAAEAPAAPVETPADTSNEPGQSAAEESWEKRFKGLQRRYNADVLVMRQQEQEREAKLHAMEQEISKLKTQPAPAPEPRASQKDVEEFGEDMVSMVRRVASDVFNGMASSFEDKWRQEVTSVRAQVGSVETQVGQSNVERFWNAVVARIPDWAAVDADPDWIAWLDVRAPGSRRSYRELAADAIVARDIEPIVEMVALWKEEKAHAAPAPVPTPAAQANPQLQRQIAPATVRSSAVAPASERVITKADVDRLGDPRFIRTVPAAELAKMQAEVDKAIAENRVRW